MTLRPPIQVPIASPARMPLFDAPNLSLGTLLMPATMSFDFPNPGRNPYASIVHAATPPNTTLRMPANIPPVTTVFDYPNPRGYAPLNQNWTPPNLTVRLPVSAMPTVHTFDFPNPGRPRYNFWYNYENPTRSFPTALSRDKIIGFPPVPEFMPDDKEHRRQMARAINGLRQGKANVTIAITLNANATTTTLTDGRIGVTSCIVPSMPTTQNGAAALQAGIWITNIVTGSCTINHANSVNTDQKIRFLIIG